MERMTETVNNHTRVNFELLDLINKELSTRPTFKQAIQHFKLNVPRVSGEVSQYNVSPSEAVKREEKIGPEVKALTQKYYEPDEEEELPGTVKDKKPGQSSLLVDTHYIDFMLSNMEEERQYEMNLLKRQTQLLQKNFDRFELVFDKEVKHMDIKVNDSLRKLKRLAALVEKNFSGRFIYFKKKSVFAALKRYAKLRERRRTFITNMTQVFSNFQQRNAMIKYKEFVNDQRADELQLKDKRYHKKVEKLQKITQEHHKQLVPVSVFSLDLMSFRSQRRPAKILRNSSLAWTSTARLRSSKTCRPMSITP